MATRRPLARPEEILQAIVELADDGFCLRSDLIPHFRKLGERELQRSVQRATRQGLLLERRGLDGRIYLALSGEGWSRLNAAPP
jgi:hypothetical protein